MGQLYQFSCPQCGYKESVGGGIGIGMMTVAVTVTCHDCRRLFDAVADQMPQEMIDDPDVSRVSGLRCPEQDSHRIDLWEAGGPCPKCGTAMDQGMADLCWD